MSIYIERERDFQSKFKVLFFRLKEPSMCLLLIIKLFGFSKNPGGLEKCSATHADFFHEFMARRKIQ